MEVLFHVRLYILRNLFSFHKLERLFGHSNHLVLEHNNIVIITIHFLIMFIASNEETLFQQLKLYEFD